MENVQKIVGSFLKINITMKTNAVLNEVIVAALGMKKEKNSTLSYQVVTESGEVNVIYSLSGKVSGLQINNLGYDKESKERVIIRGSRSITGNNIALVVIDGIISNAEIFSQLAPDIILNVTILKGAQGTALYGEQGANGVIVITTKK